MMDPAGRIVLACVATYIGWTLVKAVRSGSIQGRGITYEIHARPRLFILNLTMHTVVLLFFA